MEGRAGGNRKELITWGGLGMAKDEYTEQLQTILTKKIQRMIDKEWEIDGFITKYEYGKKDMPGYFTGSVDIGICDYDNPNLFVGIEIEHLSDFRQSAKNINKLKTWTHNSSKRKSGLLHLFNEECYMNNEQIGGLVDFALKHQKKDLGFYYEYIFYSIRNHKPETVANEIINSRNFRVKLYQLLKYADICE